MKTSSHTIRELRRHYASLLKPIYGTNESNTLIIILLEHLFGYNRMTLAMNPELCLNDSEFELMRKSMQELIGNRPIQYVTGRTLFCDMELFVNESVLIPRPETEELVYLIKDEFVNKAADGCSILDIGTGSGCIAISLGKLLEGSHVTAIDISRDALDTAMKNATSNNVTVNFLQSDILSQPQFDRNFDIIVSNPPYVCDSEKKDMRANVLDFEPATALFVDDKDPLVFYREILKLAQNTLKPDGTVWFEINERFGEETIQLCNNYGFNNSVIIKDFRGKDRFIKAIL